MAEYQINDLERLTGIKAHTIRIWEKRYGLIYPERTSTNRRSYTDNQVRKLLNVTTLLAHGHKISKIAAYTNEELNEYIQAETQKDTDDVIGAGFINDMVQTMLSYDEAGFEKIFACAVLRFGLLQTMIKIVYPFLRNTGVLWSINKTAPVQEHFASSIISRKLESAIDGQLPPTRTNSKFMLFLPEGEWHEMGLLFSNYILRAQGFPTVYLGQSVPHDGIINVINATKPNYLVIFYISHRPWEEIEQQMKSLLKTIPGLQLLVAISNNLSQNDKTSIKNVTYINSVSHFLEILSTIKK